MPYNDEQYKLAEKILEDVLTEAEQARDDIDKYVPFMVIRREPSEFEHFFPHRIAYLYYRFSSDTAEMDMEFFTEGIAENILTRCGVTLEKFLNNIIATDNKGSTHTLVDIVPSDMRQSMLEKLTQYTIEELLYGLSYRIETAVDELANEASLAAAASLIYEFDEEFGKLDISDYDIEFIWREAKRITSKAAAGKRAFIKESLSFLWETSLEELREHYNKVLPIWQDAKLLYKQNNNRPVWRDIIRAAYPEEELDDDLISRLSGKLNDLTEDVQAKLSKKGGDSKPSDIALEHAARLCGAESYQYSVRYLYHKLRKCRDGELRRSSKSQQNEKQAVKSKKEDIAP